MNVRAPFMYIFEMFILTDVRNEIHIASVNDFLLHYSNKNSL